MAFPLNRRQLLGAGLAAAIPSAHAFIPVKVPQKWDETVDVLCVGTGFSGLAAAIEAHNAGASVLVIDKMALPGGNSILAAGGFAAPGNDMQKKAGIKDSPELLLADMLRAGGHLNHVECAKVVAYGAYDTYRWATDYLGVKWDRLGFQGGHSVARSCSFMNGTGADIIGPMLTKLSTLKVPVRLRTKLLNFVTDDNGAVIGVEAGPTINSPRKRREKPSSFVLNAVSYSPPAAFRKMCRCARCTTRALRLLWIRQTALQRRVKVFRPHSAWEPALV